MRLPEPGAQVTLRVKTHVREDAIELFGFETRTEQRLFALLTTVKGIGPRLAITILSGVGTVELAAAIASGDAPRIKKIPGVGAKTAERMCLELKDKVADLAVGAPGPVPVTPLAGAEADVLSALASLGYKESEARATVERVVRETESEDVQVLLRAALKVLAK